MDHLLLSCIDSRIENNRNLYGCFQLGPFTRGQGITIANAIRRTLLSELGGLAIVCVEIQGVNHEYSNIKGIRESVLDILLNLKQLVFISNNYSTNLEIGFLKVKGPAVVKSCDLKLPKSLKCVDPTQYIATLSNNSCLEIKFMICRGKNFVIQTSFDLITDKFHFYFYDNQNNKNKNSVIKKQDFTYFKKKSKKKLQRSFDLGYLNTNLKKSIYDSQKNSICVKLYQKKKQSSYFIRVKRIATWRKFLFLKKKNFNKFFCARNVQLLKKKPFLKKKSIFKLEKKFFHNFKNVLLYSTLTISNFQSFRNLIYKQNLKKNTTTNVLLIDPVFMPIKKVNFSIQNIENFYKIKNQTFLNKFQKKSLTEKIILEIWTNGSIDPKNALYKATQKIIENFIPFQKTYLTEKKNKT